jgi:thiol-disulfide isomerase/thioredoxin
MRRYRVALAVIAVLIATAVIVTVVRQPSAPTTGGSEGGALVPAAQRLAAPEFAGIDGWVNSAPLTIQGLRGHVVLIDFWTFSCVNCVRTIPHLQQLYSANRDRGFVIVGVHSPEFDFEKVPANVTAAVQRLGVSWPVAIDSEMATWNAYSNNYWPAEYLIDPQGRIAYLNFGEGNADVTDKAVASLLGVGPAPGAAASPTPQAITPELYAGSTRGMLADGAAYGPSGQPIVYPDQGPPSSSDEIQVTGSWIDYGQYLQSASDGHVRLRFQAKDVFVVVGSASAPLAVSVRLDGSPVSADRSGPALAGSGFTVTRQDLFHVLVRVSSGYHLIELSVPAGFQLYTFTFG